MLNTKDLEAMFRDHSGPVPDPDLSDGRPLTAAAIGLGVDSVAMAIELASRGENPHLMLFADTGSERVQTYAYIDLFARWAARQSNKNGTCGIPFRIVRYRPKDYKNYPPYYTLEGNCATNGTLPSKAFGGGSCSQKWKIQPQDDFVKRWEPAVTWCASGRNVVKLIGYDCSPKDDQRYRMNEGTPRNVPKKRPRIVYDFRYPLREWGWRREDCIERIRAEGLPVPVKSACFFCPVSRPHEIEELEPQLLRRIVLMEARAAPRLGPTVEGLWRKSVKGMRGATPKPGSMTVFIRDRGLLPAGEVDRIWEMAPRALLRWQEAVAEAGLPPDERPTMAQWFALFDELGVGSFHLDGMHDLDVVGLRSRALAEAA